MSTKPKLGWDVLDLDLEQEAQRICGRIREVTATVLRKRGLVVAIFDRMLPQFELGGDS